MSEYLRKDEQTTLWWVYRPGRPGRTLFAGGLHDVIDHINGLHLETGAQYATTELGAAPAQRRCPTDESRSG